MTRRIALAASLAAAISVGGCIAVWQIRMHAVAASIVAQADVARALLSSPPSDPRLLLRSLIRPGVHVIVEDRATATIYEWRGRGIEIHPAGTLPGGRVPRVQPPDAPPRPGAQTPFDQFVAGLAHIRPIRVDGMPYSVVFTPLVNDLDAWFTGDAATGFALVIVIFTAAVRASAREVRMQRAHLEEALEERRAAAAEFQRFLGDAGHELRTPLTIVSGYTDILATRLREHPDDDVRRLLRGMTAETARMRGLVEKMLLLARLESASSVPRLIEMDRVAQEAIDAMRARFPAREVALERDGSAAIVIDQDDLYEAVHNLVENALKYAPGSPVAVQTSARDGCAALRVIDRGPGIPASERTAVFERFYRCVDRDVATEGTGLGLAIVKRVADRWNGTVALDSRPGRTVFTLSFPLAVEEKS